MFFCFLANFPPFAIKKTNRDALLHKNPYHTTMTTSRRHDGLIDNTYASTQYTLADADGIELVTTEGEEIVVYTKLSHTAISIDRDEFISYE